VLAATTRGRSPAAKAARLAVLETRQSSIKSFWKKLFMADDATRPTRTDAMFTACWSRMTLRDLPGYPLWAQD